MKHHVVASTMTVLTLAGGALGVATIGAAPASAASCATVTVSDATAALLVSSVSVEKGGCVTFSNSTGQTVKITVDGSAVGSQWSASSVGPHVVTATESGLLNLPKPGVGTITVTAPPPPPPPVPSPTVPAAGGGGGGTGGTGGSGGGGATGGGTGGSAGGSHAGGSSGGSAGGTSPRHSGGKLSGSGGSGPGQVSTGGLLSSGGFSLPSIPLNSFSSEGLAGMSNGTAPQLAPQIGATDAAGNPLPLVSSGTQNLSLAGDSRSSGNHTTIPALVAGLLILATGGGLIRTRSARRAGRSEAVDGRHALRVHRA